MTKEEILANHEYDVHYYGGGRKDILEAMEQYAKQEMAQLVENISRQPIQCYSQKLPGKDKEYFLGRTYVEDLIKRIKK